MSVCSSSSPRSSHSFAKLGLGSLSESGGGGGGRSGVNLWLLPCLEYTGIELGPVSHRWKGEIPQKSVVVGICEYCQEQKKYTTTENAVL